MKEYNIEIDGQQVTATYKTIFRHMVRIELITPYKGLKLELIKDDEECNLFVDEQAEEFVKESLVLIMKQMENVVRYRSIYSEIKDEYKKIADIMWNVLKELDMDSREKFRYHCKLREKLHEEIFKQLRIMIPEISEKNQKEFFIYFYILNEYLAVI